MRDGEENSGWGKDENITLKIFKMVCQKRWQERIFLKVCVKCGISRLI